jgi:hypothetical protein
MAPSCLPDRIRRNRRRALSLIAALAFVVASPATASANGDPPSDVLLIQDVYLPFTPAPSDGVARALLELAKRTRADRWPIKIAIIATPSDLGDVANLFTRPQDYANVLAREIGNPRLLVVTPVGFGGQKLGKGVDELSALQPVQPGSDRLERQALTAVARLAAADGHRVAVPAIDMSEQGRRPHRQQLRLHQGSPPTPRPTGQTETDANADRTSPLVYAAPVAVVLLLLTGGMLRGRIRRKREAAGREPGS